MVGVMFTTGKCRAARGAASAFLLSAALTGCGALESEPPVIAFDREFEAIGRSPALELTVSDAGSRLDRVRVVLTQDGEAVVLVDDAFEDSELRSASYDLGSLIADNFQPREGPARLAVTASDDSARNNESAAARDFRFDLYPPELQLLSPLLYINQGGSANVLYRVSDDAVESGVQVGPHFFPGFPAGVPGDEHARFALFAVAYDLPADTPVMLVARDAVGNESLTRVSNRIASRAIRERDIHVDDDFLRKVVPEIMSRTREIRDQGSLVDTYVEINSRLRELNHARIRELSATSGGDFLWEGGFLQLSNSQVEALFADRRTYYYDGEPIDQQDHVGFDLSVVARYPIEAANSGRVVLAEYFGIYGNAVIIDHGAGLMSLYGHMSSIDVRPDQHVETGEILGRSGETGLAGGDHLHFGLFLHGVPVNPIEWWDPRWIEDHVLDPFDIAAPVPQQLSEAVQ